MKFQNPPASNRAHRNGSWVDTANELAQHPNEWAVIREGIDTNQAGSLERHLLPHLNILGFTAESTGRKTDNGRYDIFARAVPMLCNKCGGTAS